MKVINIAMKIIISLLLILKAIYFKSGNHKPHSPKGYTWYMIHYICANIYSPERFNAFPAEKGDNFHCSSDFFGLNHFSTFLVEFGENGQNPSWYRDSGILLSSDETWPRTTGPWLRIVPWGLRRLLNWIKKKYNNPLVFITENGMGDNGGLNDTLRIQYLTGYVNELLKAVNLDGCNVGGYMAWSFMDNFVWTDGYTRKFGLYSVDFNDPNRKRTPKESASVYRNIIKNRGFPGPPQCVGDGK